ncbi:MAG TPA: lytic transglycosylase domain-containing protein [Kiritimatiellia bacterium]|nr:lytic transglycosylase domain-containing protein [Kiritimatiellia bacterium]
MKTTCNLSWKLWLGTMTVSLSVLCVHFLIASASGRTTGIVMSEAAVAMMGVHEANAPHPAHLAELLVESVILIESSGNPRAVGSRGERGLMQIMEGTWKQTTRSLYGKSLSFQQAFDPELNRKVGKAYLAELHEFVHANRDKWKADERSLLLACYNAGPSRVAKAGFDVAKLPASTRDYISRVTAMHDHKIAEWVGDERAGSLPVLLSGRSDTSTRDT